MPLTVITLKKVPASLRGDLTKWMQEISTGVYVGNFNQKVREKLWLRVKESIKDGEATLTYHTNSEIGYNFETLNSTRQAFIHEGIPLVLIPKEREVEKKHGFSNAAIFHQAHKYQARKKKKVGKENCQDYVVLDLETSGLDSSKDEIIEIGLVKSVEGVVAEESFLVKVDQAISKEIEDLTGINNELLSREGIPLVEALEKSLDFIQDLSIVGYNLPFDIRFFNQALRKNQMPTLRNDLYDLTKYVKLEKELGTYKLENVLKNYGIQEKQPHRALGDAKLTYDLSRKVNEFLKDLK